MSALQALMSQRETLSAQINELQAAEKASALSQVRQIMTAHNLTIQDIMPRNTRRAAGKPATAKFQGLNGEQWSGRGLIPNWLKDQMSMTGCAQSEFAINA